MPSRNSKKSDAFAPGASGGPPPEGRRTDDRLSVPGRTDQLERIRAFVSDAARRTGFTEEDVNKIELAVDEACSNVIEHAYGREVDGDIEVAVRADRGKITVTVSDTGRSFKFDGVQAPDMKRYLAELRVGGLGIYLMRMLMDDVTYRSRAGRNELRMVKVRGRSARPAPSGG
jgi:serine/threonine-protein kinase RsbW